MFIRMLITVLAVSLSLSTQLFAQDLTKARIRKLSDGKKSVYVENGIFHNGNVKNPTSLKSMRHSYQAKLGTERIVFDFGSQKIPRVYGHFNNKEKIVHIDFFDTALSDEMKSSGKTRFVEEMKFFPISEDALSLEVSMKDKVVVDVFSLENPGRLVIDVKK